MEHLSINKIKFIKSLKLRKFRDEHGLFIAEGEKILEEMLRSSCTLRMIAATREWITDHPVSMLKDVEIIEVDEGALSRISLLETPNQVLAIAEIPKMVFVPAQIVKRLTLVLDGIRDPGNLGTIIRIADWFGIHSVVCSPDTVDAYNPKVVQSSMGSLFRVDIHSVDLPSWLCRYEGQDYPPVYGTYLQGTSIYEAGLSETGLIIMGNESKGISPPVSSFVKNKLFIPSYANGKKTSESLNVAVATGIICSEFRRRK